MRRVMFTIGVLVLGLVLVSPGFCQETQESPDWGRGGGHMMGPGYDCGMHGGGWGMYGHGHMMDRGCGWGLCPRDWEAMKPEQKIEWQKMRSEYLMETLELRKQLATKQIELETLWNQPDIDQQKVEKLSGEVADLQAELKKKRDKDLLKCRKQFGDHCWACPGRW
jgi:Spy/CpxP family protein refolding chaperone